MQDDQIKHVVGNVVISEVEFQWGRSRTLDVGPGLVDVLKVQPNPQ